MKCYAMKMQRLLFCHENFAAVPAVVVFLHVLKRDLVQVVQVIDLQKLERKTTVPIHLCHSSFTE
jgi:hypothetical protein